MTTLSDMVMQCGGGGCCVLEQCFQYPRRAREPRDCGCQFALLHRADNAWPSVHVLRSQFYLLVILYLCWRETSVVPRLSPYLSTSTVSLFPSRLISLSLSFSPSIYLSTLFFFPFFFLFLIFLLSLSSFFISLSFSSLFLSHPHAFSCVCVTFAVLLSLYIFLSHTFELTCIL